MGASSFAYPRPNELTAKRSLSFVPLIAPSTSLNRIQFLASIADTFIYVVSKVCEFTFSVTLLFAEQQLDGHNWVFRERCNEC